MRNARGLRHVTTTRNLANSIKILQLELIQLAKTVVDVQRGVGWIERALEQCLNQAEGWTPEQWQKKLRLERQRRSFRDCFKGQVELETTFEDLFGLKDFGLSNSFQIRFPIRNARMEFL